MIRTGEAACPFAALNAARFARNVLEENVDDKLSTVQLRKVFKKLGLSKSLLQNPDSAFFRFMMSTRDGRLYDLPKVLLAGILLSGGSLTEKAGILFDHFDENANGQLESHELYQAFALVFDVSVNCTSTLGLGPDLSPEALSKYQAGLNKHREEYIVDHVMIVTRGQKVVTKEIFLRAVTSHQLASLTCANKVRESVCRVYRNSS